MTEHPTIVLIPARLRSTRLPDKPLAEIGGVPMIVQVWRRACEAEVGPVVGGLRRAGDRRGGRGAWRPRGADRPRASVRHRPHLPGLRQIDPDGRFGHVINLQGDLPTLDPAAIRAVLAPIERLGTDLGTLATAIRDPDERDDPNVVKPVLAIDPEHPDLARALYFSRATVPSGDGPVYHHIGIYAYRRAALERLAVLPPSPLERRERLEQLRALENGTLDRGGAR